MVRKLKHHEQLLLKKHNFYYSKRDTNTRELIVMRRYHVEDRGDYQKYNRLLGGVTQLAHRLKKLPAEDPFRIAVTNRLLDKLYGKGLISNKHGSLEEIEAKLCVSSFCRRRLPVVMVNLKMAETVKAATTLIHHGHVRVGPEVVKDPAFLVTRSLEDHVTWVEGSKVKRTISKYNDQFDDYDFMNL